MKNHSFGILTLTSLFLINSFYINFIIVLYSNINETTHATEIFVRSTLYFFIFLSIALLLIKYLSSFLKYLYIILYFLTILSFISNIISFTPKIDEPNNYNVIYAVIISFVFILISFKSKKITNFFIQLIIISCVINFTYITSNIIFFKSSENLNNEEKIKEKFNYHTEINYSNKLNIFVISFDSLSSIEFEKLINVKKELRYLKDFTFFKNTISKAPGSASSLGFDFIGNIELKSNQITQDLLTETVKENINLLNKKVKIQPFGYYNYFFNKDRLYDFKNNDISIIHKEITRFLIESSKRFFTKLPVNYLIKESNNSNWLLKESLNQYDIYLKHLNNSKSVSQPVITTGHWSFTHYPNIYDENCNENTMADIQDERIQKEKQNEKLQLELTLCSLKKFKEFINILKKNRIYDQSLIIFKSDHGPPSHIYKNNNFLSKSLNNSIYGYSRHRPLLLIKLPHLENESIKINNQVVFLSDIYQLLCEQIYGSKDKIQNSCIYKDYIKNSIKSETNINRNEEIFIDDGSSSHRLDQNKRISLMNINSFNIDEKLNQFFNKSNKKVNLIDQCYITDNLISLDEEKQRILKNECLSIDKDKRNILFVGGDLSKQLSISFLKKNYKDIFNPSFIFSSQCVPRYYDNEYSDFDGYNCEKMNKLFTEFARDKINSKDVIILSTLIRHDSINIDKLKKLDGKIIITGSLPIPIIDLNDIIDKKDHDSINLYIDKKHFDESIFKTEDKVINKLKNINNINYFSVLDKICIKNQCNIKIENTKKFLINLYPVGDRLTKEGSDYIMNMLSEEISKF